MLRTKEGNKIKKAFKVTIKSIRYSYLLKATDTKYDTKIHISSQVRNLIIMSCSKIGILLQKNRAD